MRAYQSRVLSSTAQVHPRILRYRRDTFLWTSFCARSLLLLSQISETLTEGPPRTFRSPPSIYSHPSKTDPVLYSFPPISLSLSLSLSLSCLFDSACFPDLSHFQKNASRNDARHRSYLVNPSVLSYPSPSPPPPASRIPRRKSRGRTRIRRIILINAVPCCGCGGGGKE